MEESFLYVLLWCITSSSAVTLNKWLLIDAHYKYPILLAAWHLVFATVVTQILARTTSLLDTRHSIPLNVRFYTQTLLPVGLSFAGSLVCSNLIDSYALPHLQLLEAVAPVATLVASWLFRVAEPNAFSSITILAISSGIVIAASGGKSGLSGIGPSLQLSGTAFQALRLVLTQVMLGKGKPPMNPLVGLYYQAPVCACMLALFSVVMEGGSLELSEVVGVASLILLIGSAVVAFSLHLSTFLLIAKSSALVVTLTGTFQIILSIPFAIVFWHSHISVIQGLGYGIALLGLVCYSLGYETSLAYWNNSVSQTLQVDPNSKTLQLNLESKSTQKRLKYLAAALLSLILLVRGVVGGFGVPGQTRAQRTMTSTDDSVHPLYPSQATCGGASFTRSRQQWAAAVDKYAGLMEDKFTIAIQTYQRPDSINATVEVLIAKEIPSLYEIAVIWNEIDGKPPASFVSKHGVNVRYTLAEQNSLNSKLLPDPKYKTQAILLHDDDIYYHPEDLDFVFQTWRQFGKQRMTGGLPRCTELKDGKLKYTFCSENSDTYEIVLTNLAFSHISFLDFYSSDNYYATAVRDHVDKVFNCEDIGMNYIHSMLTCTGPLQVVGRQNYVTTHSKFNKGISTGKDHLKIRSECLNVFQDFFGYPVLVGQTGRIHRGVKRLQG